MNRSTPRGNARPRAHIVAPGLVALLLPLLAGCAYGPPKSAQELATEDFCRQQANQVYDLQHREQLIAEDNSETPMSSSGMVSNPSAGLSELYAHDERVDNCVTRRTSATTTGTTFGSQGSN